jgi:thiamine biosynthesis protein ThiS
MKIILNNKPQTFDTEQLTINQIIEQMNFSYSFFVTKLNGELIRKEKRDSTYVKNGDNLLILNQISGG